MIDIACCCWKTIDGLCLREWTIEEDFLVDSLLAHTVTVVVCALDEHIAM